MILLELPVLVGPFLRALSLLLLDLADLERDFRPTVEDLDELLVDAVDLRPEARQRRGSFRARAGFVGGVVRVIPAGVL